MTRAVTADELREIFLRHVASMARYWAKLPGGGSVEDRCRGVAFSILSAIDGVAGSVPVSFNLVASPHEDDKAFYQAEGQNWIEPGTVINADVMLHEEFASMARRRT